MSKILFVRHGESEDDLTNQFGGWLDLSLTDAGRQQAKDAASEIASLDVEFSKILHSPLKRAKETAEILGENLDIAPEESVWLKERNGYGLLTGLNREDAAKNYPDLFKDLQNGYVFGMERSEDFQERVVAAFDTLKDYEEDIIVVSHGGFTSRLFDVVLGSRLKNIGDLGYILVGAQSKDIIASSRVQF